mmetsp:Transcript_617/g.1464  ORF Transcript_617/g.1464 Transcript_617/m.1464 type:complete len:227 (+) Transcript_617:95-775(+)
MSRPRSTSGVHSSSVAFRFLKSSTVRTASLPCGSSTASWCWFHRLLRSGMAAASAAAAEGTKMMVRGGGASSPAARKSARICRARAMILRMRGTTNRRCTTEAGTRPGLPMDTAMGAVRCPRCSHSATTSSGTLTPHSTTCRSSITGAKGEGASSSAMASGCISNSWSASSAMMVVAKSTSSRPARFMRARLSGVPTTISAVSANPTRVSCSSENTPTTLIPCGPV